VAKIETAIKEAIHRGARRQVRVVTTSLRREVRRLRQAVARLRREFGALRDVAGQWQRVVRVTPWQPPVSDTELRTARLSPRLIQKLRARLRLSQAGLARLVGVSTAAVLQWERGRSAPSGQNRRNLVGLRKLGRRDVKRLLAETERRAPARARSRQRARPRRRARRGRK
jgi:DNA-binding XRE family transcriptional regulator